MGFGVAVLILTFPFIAAIYYRTCDNGPESPTTHDRPYARITNVFHRSPFSKICNFTYYIDLRRRPYNTLALPCECVIRTENCAQF